MVDRDVKIRSYIMDSLIARSGKTLSPELIGEIAGELQERILEVIEVPLAQIEGYEHL